MRLSCAECSLGMAPRPSAATTVVAAIPRCELMLAEVAVVVKRGGIHDVALLEFLHCIARGCVGSMHSVVVRWRQLLDISLAFA